MTMKWSFSYHSYVKLSLYEMTHSVSFIIKLSISMDPEYSVKGIDYCPIQIIKGLTDNFNISQN